jgi:hypothetical protein
VHAGDGAPLRCPPRLMPMVRWCATHGGTTMGDPSRVGGIPHRRKGRRGHVCKRMPLHRTGKDRMAAHERPPSLTTGVPICISANSGYVDNPASTPYGPRTTVVHERGERYGKVGARRTAELCFPTPPSEPGMRLSPHPALRLSVSLSFLSM